MKYLRIVFFTSLIASSWVCMRNAVRVQSGENPFISGNVVFEGSISLYVLEPKRVGAVEWGNGRFSDNVSAWHTGDFKLRFIAADGHFIDCPVNDGRFDCVLPQARYKYFLLQGLNLAGMSGMVSSGVKLQEFLQWFRIPEQATATGITNHLGRSLSSTTPTFNLPGITYHYPMSPQIS